jgi:hypothetical protein
MAAPPDPELPAPAAASLRAPEVARLREEQEKVTGRASAPRRASARPAPRRSLRVPDVAPVPAVPEPRGRNAAAGKVRGKLSSRAFVVFVCSPVTPCAGHGGRGAEPGGIGSTCMPGCVGIFYGMDGTH